jgi:hypothetical protein
MPPREATRERDEPPAPKKPRTEGSRTGQRKGKKKKSRGGKRSPSGGGQWNPHHGRKKYAAHPAPATTEQPEPKRRRTAATAADAAIAAGCAQEVQDVPGDDGKAYKKARPLISFTAVRFAIAYTFVEIFGAPSKCEWNSLRDADDDQGNKGWIKGTILLIKEKLEMEDNAFRTIRRTLERVEYCAEHGEEYDGLTMGMSVQRTGKCKIKMGSWEMELVALDHHVHC